MSEPLEVLADTARWHIHKVYGVSLHPGIMAEAIDAALTAHPSIVADRLGVGGLAQENDELHDDVVTALRIRDLALEEAATEIQPGPDGQDYIDRARMIARWLTIAHGRNDEGEESGHKAWVETELARLAPVSVPEPSEGEKTNG